MVGDASLSSQYSCIREGEEGSERERERGRGKERGGEKERERSLLSTQRASEPPLAHVEIIRDLSPAYFTADVFFCLCGHALGTPPAGDPNP